MASLTREAISKAADYAQQGTYTATKAAKVCRVSLRSVMSELKRRDVSLRVGRPIGAK